MHRTSYSKREEFELRLVRSPMKRCGALKAPAEGVLPPFAKFCPEREVGPSCGAQRAGARLLTRGSVASDPQRRSRAQPRSRHGGREERRGGLLGPALTSGRPTTRLPWLPGQGVGTQLGSLHPERRVRSGKLATVAKPWHSRTAACMPVHCLVLFWIVSPCSFLGNEIRFFF